MLMFVKINNMIRKVSIRLMNKKQYISYLRRGGGYRLGEIAISPKLLFLEQNLGL